MGAKYGMTTGDVQNPVTAIATTAIAKSSQFAIRAIVSCRAMTLIATVMVPIAPIATTKASFGNRAPCD